MGSVQVRSILCVPQRFAEPAKGILGDSSGSLALELAQRGQGCFIIVWMGLQVGVLRSALAQASPFHCSTLGLLPLWRLITGEGEDGAPQSQKQHFLFSNVN